MMMRISLVLVAIVGLAGLRPAAAPQTEAVASTTGLVVSWSSHASDVGAEILSRGGNAVDAAVATAFALAVSHPSAGNIGGGGFMIVRTPKGDATSFDYREKAPLKATPTMYLDASGRIDRSLTNAGYLAPGVPGTVRGLALAHEKFGKLPWKDLVLPAVKLADEGFALHDALARSLNTQLEGGMGKFPASVAAYGKPGGGKWAGGDRLVLKDLSRTLLAIAEEGPDAFYRGWIADRIAEDMQANGGIISKEDLAAYEAKQRVPLKGRFRTYEVISMPPPSSGGVALIEMLNILETFDLKAKGRYSPDTLHLMIEAMRRGYLDRARHLGDPDFSEIPVARLISKPYAKTLAATIDPKKASSSVELGKDIVTTAPTEPDETTHFSVIDKDGMGVTSTYTLEGGFGSRVVVKGAGFLLNNEMGDFNQKPGETNVRGDIGTPANVIAPGKRMLSSMTPTIVTKDGRLVLLTGSPGGRTIINTVLNVVLNVVEFGMTGRDVVDSARMHHQWLPDEATIEENGVPPDSLKKLQDMGHKVKMGGRQGDAHSILVNPRSGVAYGLNDRRSADSKASRAKAPEGSRP